MQKHITAGLVVAVVVILAAAAGILPRRVQAAWLAEGNPICVATEDQESSIMVDDGDGGMIIVWVDERNGNRDIYAQRVDMLGNPLWADGGVPVCTVTGNQQDIAAVSDEAGGVIVTWEDWRSGSYSDIYCQRLGPDGVRLWSTAGSSICSAASNQYSPQITVDGANGAIVTWHDYRNGNYDIYARRIDSSGTPQWTLWGEPVCVDAAYQLRPQIVSSGDGGVIIAWEDARNGPYDIYLQSLLADGSASLTADGISACTATGSQSNIRMVSSGLNEAIIIWVDERTAVNSQSLYGQRLVDGYCSWGADGREICPATGAFINSFDLAMDTSERIITAWTDNSSGLHDVYASCTNIYGTPIWGAGGVVVCDADGHQTDCKVISSPDGNTIISWMDERDAVHKNIYAQRLDMNGNVQWTAAGVKVSGESRYKSYSDIMPDGEGGAFFCWSDTRNDPAHIENDIYSQRIERNGYRGYPAPEIYTVRDVPGDEGGKVNLAWFSSYLDPWPYQEITHYTIWKAIDPLAASMLLARDGARTMDSFGEMPAIDQSGPVIRIEKSAGSTFFWELVDSQAAQYYEQYSRTISTGFDSSAAVNEYHYFQVAAHTADPLVVWTSQPDSGYSVDNLAPATPLGLAGEQLFTPEGLNLSWEENTEEDLEGYFIYRGLAEDFEPGTTTLIATTTQADYFDENWDWEADYWYKVAAFDVHDNTSGFALLGPGSVTGDDLPDAPAASYLAQNYPNPFNPSTIIKFATAGGSRVSLKIYDISGRLVRVIVEETRPAGYYEENWNGLNSSGQRVASGVYYYRLITGEFEETKKMILLR